MGMERNILISIRNKQLKRIMPSFVNPVFVAQRPDDVGPTGRKLCEHGSGSGKIEIIVHIVKVASWLTLLLNRASSANTLTV